MTRSLPSVTEMADYAISGVRYGNDRSMIYKARVHRVQAGQVLPPLEVLRAQLVAALEYGRTFTTIALNERTYSAVAPVRLVLVAGRPYVRGDAEARASDDLPGVAEF